ncbi:endo-1,4-beta-xylanase [Legionella gratiana]|uniref:Endo-1,4-beta-xylanase n=1 Tax=Legionella gratiana TaxID=45066 RepID=A0A378JDY8_9GAMM|nr:RsiV family protein [Legionella gratiana]KTD08953.1 endo-1,4-beta-xylanase [Legionella gratiana]STX45835.1 endo-1,4-beta-xylanase [Legionella gratiana]
MLKLLKIVLSFCLIACSFVVYAIYPVSVQKETAAYILDIKYPEGFKDPRIDATLQGFIENAKQRFFKGLGADADVPADAPGKSGLNITYSLPYKTKNALSVQFMISINHKGAAHPANTVSVLNFISGSQVQLSDLFRPEVDYLKPIADFCSKKITAKNISDKKWVDEGTKATDKNYKIWSFSSKGIDIIFDTYQVAAYVYGPQTVSVPLSQIASLLKPEVAHSVWGR